MKRFKGETLQAKVINALKARIESANNENMKKTLIVELSQFESKSAIAVLSALQGLEYDVEALSKRIAISDKADSAFIAVYALQKVRKAIYALALKSSANLDRYTFSIVKNLVELQKLDNLNTQRTICSKIELDELQQAQVVRVYHNCAPSTASTQASSTRMMLQALAICDVSKGKKGDSISFADSNISKAMQELFAN
jgi:uncharacterized protein YqfB (UPF0267 family)